MSETRERYGSEEVSAADANLLALSDLHRALSAAYEAAFPGQVADTPRAAIGALVLEVGRLRDEGKRDEVELEAAREFIRMARLAGVDGLCEVEDTRRWLAALRAYDAAVKAREP